MQASGKRVTSVLVMAAMASVGLLGCDSETGKADKSVQKTVAQSVQKRAGYNENSVNLARQLLESTIGEKDAGSAARAIARGALAQAELDSANLTIAELSAKQNEVMRAVIELNHLLGQVSQGNTLIAGYQKLNPSRVIAGVNQQIAEVRGGAGKTGWIATGNSVIKTQAEIKQDISRLQDHIGKLQAEISATTGRRDKTLADAAAADQASESAKGQDAVDLYKKGSDLRKAAADLQNKLDVQQLALQPLQADLKIAQGQQEVLDKALAEFAQQLSGLQKVWTDIEAKIAEQEKAVKELVQGTTPAAVDPIVKGAGISITEKADYVAQLVVEAKTLRDTADQKLNNSIQHFNDAAAAADELRGKLQKLQNDEAFQKAPEAATWKMLQGALDPAGFKIQQSGAERLKADLFAGQVQMNLARINLYAAAKPVLDAAKLTVPASLDSAGLGLESELQAAKVVADNAYLSASDRLQGIFDGTATPERKTAAQVQRMVTMYGWAQLALATGDKQNADAHLADAVQSRDRAGEGNAVFPPLPVGLALPVNAVPAPAPGNSPNTPPTTPAPTPTDPFTAPKG